MSEKGLVPAPLPKWVLPLLSKIKEQTGLFPLGLNHVLLNAYRPGEGILVRGAFLHLKLAAAAAAR